LLEDWSERFDNVIDSGLFHVWGIEPDPRVLDYAVTYEAQRADLQTVSSSA
jgi:hypothetical protein